MYNLVRLLVIAVLCVVALPAAAQPAVWSDRNLEPVFHAPPAGTELLRLDNGLDVVLMRNPAQPMVGIYTQVKVGSAREDERTSGMSHMLEHLLFNGSAKYTQDELYALADRVGAYNNANTSDFYTNYMLVLPAGELETGLDIQSQMLFHSLIPTGKFTKEQGIVLGEIAQSRDWPGHDVDTALRAVLFDGSSLELPTLGTPSTIANMERDDVHAFYRTWYVPNNMVLTLAGNFDRDRAVALLEQYYGAAAPGTLPDRALVPAAPLDRTHAVTRRAGSERKVALAFAAPTYGMADFHAFQVAAELLTLEGSGVLPVLLDTRDESVRPEVSTWWQAAPGFGRLVLEFTLPEGVDPGLCYGLLQDALVASHELGIADEDVLGIVRMAETATLLEREQLRMTGIYIAEPLTLGGVDFFVDHLDRLREVTPAEVVQTLRHWLVDAPCAAVLVEPTVAGGPGGGRPGMPAGMGGMGHGMGAPAGGGTPAEAETPAIPVATVERKVDRSVLENGAVLVTQTNADSPLVAVHLTVRGRAMIDSENAVPGALDVVHRLLGEGYAGCDRACLGRQIRALGAVIKSYDDSRIPMDDYYTNGRFSFVRLESAADNGAAVLELLTQQIQHALFNGDAFARVRDERTGALGRREGSARATAKTLLRESLYGDHPLALAPEGTVASLAELSFNQVRVVYRRAFSPENLVISVVGPLAHDEVKSILETGLPGRGQPAPGLPPVTATAAASEATATVGGPMAAVRLGTLVEVDSTDAPALRLAVALLSDQLGMDLRETRGLSYSVGAAVGVHGGVADFTAWINPPQARLAEARQALRQAVAGWNAAAVTQGDLDRVRSARNGRLMMRRLSSMGQAYYLAMAELEGDLGAYLDADTVFDGVTLAQVRAAAARYLAAAPLVEVVVD
ncbi:MAG: insulinase family protein [bacterium]|nr:insulinase family protein [bacterium]